MGAAQPKTGPNGKPGPASHLRAAAGLILYILLIPALLFIAAGTLDWPAAWAYTVLLLASTVGSRLIALMRYPDLLRERARFAEAEGAQAGDRLLVILGAMLGPMAMNVVAGLDQRWGWSALVPPEGQVLAGLVVALGYGMAVWAMAINRYFSAVARIQEDRGQTVVTGGPYRIVRHPSYAGGLYAAPALAFMLDALWALIPALLIIIVLVVRTQREDQMLLQGLEGYRAYAQRTRFRLVPGIW